MVHEIENFYGVYLLYNINPKYKGRIYIGYTVDPNRRIRQHNTGKKAGGAWKTHGKGPWEMVLTIHGFPNSIPALRFEWAWQNPQNSRRLKHLPKKKYSESAFQYRFRILSEMLQTGPWCRLPLTVQWLKQEYMMEFSPKCQPPIHMPVAYGPVRSKKVDSSQSQCTELAESGMVNHDLCDLPQPCRRWRRCAVCCDKIVTGDETLNCIQLHCTMVTHLTCLAKTFSSDNYIVPIQGKCPTCKTDMLWGDLIRYKMGCYQSVSNDENSADSDDHWADELSQKALN